MEYENWSSATSYTATTCYPQYIPTTAEDLLPSSLYATIPYDSYAPTTTAVYSPPTTCEPYSPPTSYAAYSPGLAYSSEPEYSSPSYSPEPDMLDPSMAYPSTTTGLSDAFDLWTAEISRSDATLCPPSGYTYDSTPSPVPYYTSPKPSYSTPPTPYISTTPQPRCARRRSPSSAPRLRSNSTPAGSETHVCPETGCNQTFARLNALNRHIASIHQQVGVSCPFCQNPRRKFNRSDNFRRHVDGRHKEISRDDLRLLGAMRALYQGDGRRSSWRRDI